MLGDVFVKFVKTVFQATDIMTQPDAPMPSAKEIRVNLG